MGADYLLELISIETYAPQFIGHNKIFLGSVSYLLMWYNYSYTYSNYVNSLIFSNPLECKCELEWLQKLLKSKASKSLLPPITCKEPQDLSGVELTRIKVL